MANFLKGTLLFSRLYECVIHRLSFIISQVYYLVRKNTFLNAFKAFFFKKKFVCNHFVEIRISKSVFKALKNNKMKQKIVVFLFLIIGINWHCRDRIDLVPDQEQLSSISIQSQLIKGNPSVIRTPIERVFTFSAESRKVLPITSVILEDDLGNEFPLSRSGIGHYIGVIPENYPTF